jgi:hypothetical protein
MMQTLCKRSDWGYPPDGVDPPAWYPFSGGGVAALGFFNARTTALLNAAHGSDKDVGASGTT